MPNTNSMFVLAYLIDLVYIYRHIFINHIIHIFHIESTLHISPYKEPGPLSPAQCYQPAPWCNNHFLSKKHFQLKTFQVTWPAFWQTKWCWKPPSACLSGSNMAPLAIKISHNCMFCWEHYLDWDQKRWAEGEAAWTGGRLYYSRGLRPPHLPFQVHSRCFGKIELHSHNRRKTRIFF